MSADSHTIKLDVVSLRDYFAMNAMRTYLQILPGAHQYNDAQMLELVHKSYHCADMMLSVRRSSD